MPFPTPLDALEIVIKTWEGGWQDDPNDSGNYAHGHDGTVRLVGTMRGITPDAYAAFLGVDPATITVEMLRDEVTLEVAGRIGFRNFYQARGFARLLWSPLVDIALDIGFMSGPGRAVRMLQGLVGTTVDGGIGEQTAEAMDLYLEAHGVEAACNALADARIAFYRSISEPGTKNARFRQGWINRANWARPSDTGAWWARWKGWTMPYPAGSSKATGIIKVL